MLSLSLRRASTPGGTPKVRRPVLSPQTLPDDVIYNILCQLLCHKGSLNKFSRTCRRIRALCMRLLFKRSCIICGYNKQPSPPDSIRHLVRHITVHGTLKSDANQTEFTTQMQNFPSVSSVLFERCYDGIPWTVLKSCFAHNVKDVSFAGDSGWGWPLDTPEGGLGIVRNGLRALSYQVVQWREIDIELALQYTDTIFANEAAYLRPLVLGMHQTAESLTLPMETAPLAEMTHLAWPRMRSLSFHGQYPKTHQTSILPTLIRAMPPLHTLSIRVAQPPGLTRPPILGRLLPSAETAVPDLSQLRSLCIAFPDPDDAVFSVKTPLLTRLALSDWPRYYYCMYDPPVGHDWTAPILTASECLRILHGMQLTLLESLELAYEVDDAEADKAILALLVHRLPCLVELELHRYKQRETDIVPYEHIARTLSAISQLRVVRLNLDFHDTCPVLHEEYKRRRNDRERLWAWRQAVHDRGKEVFDIFRAACPSLESVALIDHGYDSWWEEWRPLPGSLPDDFEVRKGAIDCEGLPYRIR